MKTRRLKDVLIISKLFARVYRRFQGRGQASTKQSYQEVENTTVFFLISFKCVFSSKNKILRSCSVNTMSRKLFGRHAVLFIKPCVGSLTALQAFVV